jgi:hypothetical protein
MGAANSPAIACRINNGALRQLRKEAAIFQGDVVENTWRSTLAGEPYDKQASHGRNYMGKDGQYAALIWAMVDDYLIHAPTKTKCCEAFSTFMDYMVRLGFICQKIKTSPPAQIQKYCGMIFDTTGVPTIHIPEEKVSRSLATIAFVKAINAKSQLLQLSASVMGGLLQSLVVATPSQQGQTYLRPLYDDVHTVDESDPKLKYYTQVALSPKTLSDLSWWEDFLHANPGNRSPTGSLGSLTATWGDGSGTGTGGTIETLDPKNPDTSGWIDTWMGTWAPIVSHFDSNWRELRTLLWTLERLYDRNPDGHIGGTLFYFTDNLVSYYAVQNGSSSSPALHDLVRQIKKLGCRVEMVHVPGLLMIEEGTDGLSRGHWISPDRMLRSTLEESRMTLKAIPLTHCTEPMDPCHCDGASHEHTVLATHEYFQLGLG